MFPEQYQSLEKIAQGGNAEVYRATVSGSSGLSDFHRTVALKRILPVHAENKVQNALLINEAKLLVSLTHPNIVRVFDLGFSQNAYFLVMEYVDGCDLRAVMRHYASQQEQSDPDSSFRPRGRLPLDCAVLIACEICKGLDYAHQKTDAFGEPLELVHMDISPKNVLISRWGEVKLTDFGIASVQKNRNAIPVEALNSARGKAAATDKDKMRVIRGKYSYMSPEQAMGWPVTAQSDIFSVGLLLYEILSGSRLYKSDNIQGLQWEHQNMKVSAPLLPQEIPAELEYIVLNCLAYEPEERYASANALYRDLLRFLIARLGAIPHQQLASMMEDVLAEDDRLYRAKEAEKSASNKVDASQKEWVKGLAPAFSNPQSINPHRDPNNRPVDEELSTLTVLRPA